MYSGDIESLQIATKKERTAMQLDNAPTRTVDGREIPMPGTWEFDPGHTEVGFEGRHLMVTRVAGRFDRFSGRLHVAEVPEESSGELTIEAASLSSNLEDRDRHLRSPDFLDVERYPTITFRSTAIEHRDGNRWKVTGQLTIKDITRPVTLEAEFLGAVRDPWGGTRIGFTAAGAINREEWGLTWNMVLETGGVVLGKTIRLIMSVDALLGEGLEA
jgi:polyisoprenoid-binding protein YceI